MPPDYHGGCSSTTVPHMGWLARHFEILHTHHAPIRAMEGIRGLAVFLVFLVHYSTLAEPWMNPAHPGWGVASQVRGLGNIGVDLFFTLSGYLIYGMLLGKDRPLRSYLARRVQRIYPVFTAVFALYLVLSAVFPAESRIPAGWPGVWYVLQNYLLLPGIFPITPIITVAWSLSYEFLFYLFTPLFVGGLGLRGWSPTARTALLLAIAVGGFAVASVAPTHIRLLMFFSGMVLFEVQRSGPNRVGSGVGLLAFASAIVAALLMAGGQLAGLWKFAALFVLFPLFCLECFSPGTWAARIFCTAPLRWLGNMSYSYYLIHGLALKFVFLVAARLVGPPGGDATAMAWALLPLAFGLTLIPSAMLFLWVERPWSLDVATPASRAADISPRK